MNNQSPKSKNGSINDLPEEFSTSAFKRKKKNTKLPDAFFPSWQMELLSSFVAIFLLWMLPDWVMDTNNFLSSKHGIYINSAWMDFVCYPVMAGFIMSLIMRIVWLSLVWKWRSNRVNPDSEMFRSLSARRIKLQNKRTQNIAIMIDRVAEILFFASSIILFLILLSYLIHVLGSLLNHSMHKAHNIYDQPSN